MALDAKMIVPMPEASQSFEKITRLVNELGLAAISENSKPIYIVLGFSEYEELQAIRAKYVEDAVDKVIAENIEALKELAK